MAGRKNSKKACEAGIKWARKTGNEKVTEATKNHYLGLKCFRF